MDDRLKTDGKEECFPFPEALDQIFESDRMQVYPEDVREQTDLVLRHLEGSNGNSGLTCIAESDLPRITQQVQAAIDDSSLQNAWTNPRGTNRLVGLIRGMNRHCDQCLRRGCENRVTLTREDIKRLSARSYTTSRRSKVSLPSIADQLG